MYQFKDFSFFTLEHERVKDSQARPIALFKLRAMYPGNIDETRVFVFHKQIPEKSFLYIFVLHEGVVVEANSSFPIPIAIKEKKAVTISILTSEGFIHLKYQFGILYGQIHDHTQENSTLVLKTAAELLEFMKTNSSTKGMKSFNHVDSNRSKRLDYVLTLFALLLAGFVAIMAFWTPVEPREKHELERNLLGDAKLISTKVSQVLPKLYGSLGKSGVSKIVEMRLESDHFRLRAVGSDVVSALERIQALDFVKNATVVASESYGGNEEQFTIEGNIGFD